MEPSSKLIGIHGRLRQHITAAGGGRGGRVSESRGRKAVGRDKFLQVHLRNGTLSDGEIHGAVEAFNRDPYIYAWLRDVSEQVVDKADGVFFVRYGRYPTTDADFKLNGHYHRICKSIQYDSHHHDAELSRLRLDENGSPYVVGAELAGILRDVEQVTTRCGSAIWSIVFGVLALIGGALLTIHIVYQVPAEPSVVIGLCGVVWILLCLSGLVTALPRCREKRREVSMCSKCHKELEPSSTPHRCPHCDVAFDTAT